MGADDGGRRGMPEAQTDGHASPITTEERSAVAAIVEWLREGAHGSDAGIVACRVLADAVARGDWKR